MSIVNIKNGKNKKNMPRNTKPKSEEAMAWGRMMAAKRKAKGQHKENKKDLPQFLVDIADKYFPEAGMRVQDRGRDYSIEIIFGAEDVRAFVVRKPTARMELENWCKKIQANLEGKSLNEVVGLNVATPEVPPEIGQDSEFFFKAE